LIAYKFELTLLLRTKAVHRKQRLGGSFVSEHAGGDHRLRAHLVIRVAEERYEVRARGLIANLDERAKDLDAEILVRIERVGQMRNCRRAAQHAQRSDCGYAHISISITARRFANRGDDRRIDGDIRLNYFVIAGIQEWVEQIPALAPIGNEVDVVLGVKRNQRSDRDASNGGLLILERVDHLGKRREVFDLAERLKRFGADDCVFILAGGDGERFDGELVSNAAFPKFARGVQSSACDRALQISEQSLKRLSLSGRG